MKTICFLDTESTGLEITKDRIIQISLIRTDSELNIQDKKKLLLSNCGVPIHPDAFKAHGISDADLVGKFTFQQYSNKIKTYLDECDYIGGYNIKGFDIPLLYEEFIRAGLIWEPKPIIDSCVIFKRREERNLKAAYRFYTGNEFGDGLAHDAENDVLATIEVLKGQINMYDFGWIRNNETQEIEKDEIPIEEKLISESKYSDEDKRLSWDGKIILNEDGKAIYNFGKYKNLNFDVRTDLGYANWILNGDFPSQTKNVLKALIS